MQVSSTTAGILAELDSRDAVYEENNSTLADGVTWRRIDPAQTWKPDAEANGMTLACDIVQGALGNCYFLSAMTLMATQPRSLMRVFRTTPAMAARGLHCFQFFSYGAWNEVIIDDKIPIIKNRSAFASNVDVSCAWVALLEKAFAKFFGSYANLEGGNMSEALVDLTGACVQDLNLTVPTNKDSLVERLLSAKKQGFLIAAGPIAKTKLAESKANSVGIVTGHAYSVLETFATAKSAKSRLFLQLRNPTGREEWNGRYSRTNPVDFAKLFPKRRQPQALPKGNFYIECTEFQKHFNRLYVCKPDVGWRPVDCLAAEEGKEDSMWSQEAFVGSWSCSDGTAGGCTAYATFHDNARYQVTLPPSSTPTQLMALVSQPDQRASRAKPDVPLNYEQIAVSIFHDAGDSPFLALNSQLGSEAPSYWNKRDACIDVMVPASDKPRRLFVVPATYYPEKESPFRLLIASNASDMQVALFDEKSRYACSNVVLGEWKSSGGQAKDLTFTNNPMYELTWNEGANTEDEKTGVRDVFISLRTPPHRRKAMLRVGVYVLNQAKVKLPEQMQKSRVEGTFKFQSHSVNGTFFTRHMQLDMANGPFLLVPATYSARKACAFKLAVHCSSEHSVTLKKHVKVKKAKSTAVSKRTERKTPVRKPVVSSRTGRSNKLTVEKLNVAKSKSNSIASMYANLE